MELKGSKTEQNLMTAFAGESQAHVKYTYYQNKAKKTVTYRYQNTLKKLQETRENTQKSGSSSYMTE